MSEMLKKRSTMRWKQIHQICCVRGLHTALGPHTVSGVALRIKLRPGLKLCKLPGRFWASVNKVNYGVNYKFLPGHV